MKKSFLSTIIGRNTYDEFKGYAKIIIAIGTCVLGILLLLSSFFHWGVIRSLLNLITGTSLLFIAYIAALVLVLDVEVDVDEPESNYWSESENNPNPTAYNLTIVWDIVLVIMGIAAIYFSNNYRKHYAFECETFLVDTEAGIYHLDYNNDCEVAACAYNLVKMKGYEIEDLGYILCDWCNEWAADEEDYFETIRYVRR